MLSEGKVYLTNFETIQNIKNASVDELMAVPGISEQIAKSIYNFSAHMS